MYGIYAYIDPPKPPHTWSVWVRLPVKVRGPRTVTFWSGNAYGGWLAFRVP